MPAIFIFLVLRCPRYSAIIHLLSNIHLIHVLTVWLGLGLWFGLGLLSCNYA